MKQVVGAAVAVIVGAIAFLGLAVASGVVS